MLPHKMLQLARCVSCFGFALVGGVPVRTIENEAVHDGQAGGWRWGAVGEEREDRMSPPLL